MGLISRVSSRTYRDIFFEMTGLLVGLAAVALMCMINVSAQSSGCTTFCDYTFDASDYSSATISGGICSGSYSACAAYDVYKQNANYYGATISDSGSCSCGSSSSYGSSSYSSLYDSYNPYNAW